MLKGDLTSTPLAPLLLDLAADSATGCLSVSDSDGDEALVYLKGGLIYAIAVPGSRPQLGAKLVSSGALAPEALAEALDAQRTELQGWRLGELLVHLGYVDQPVVEAFVKEQVHEALWDLMRWSEGRWRFRKNSRTREDVGPPMIVVELLESLRARGYQWETISAIVHGPNAVPMLSARGDSAAETTLDNDAWSMLCKIDGQRTVAELARDCGYTLFEAGHVIVSLVQAGLVDIEEQIDVEGAESYGASSVATALAADRDDARDADDDALTRLAKLVTEVTGAGGPDDAAPHNDTAPIAPAQRSPDADLDHSLTVPLHGPSGESFAASIARVSGALADVLGPPQDVADDIDPLLETRKAQRLTPEGEDADEHEDDEWERRRRLRSAAAAELINAQALADALRPDRNTTDELVTDETPRLIDAAKAVERAREEAERNAAEDAAREAAERFARAAAEEAQRLAAEQATKEAERQATEEAARLAAEEAERQAAEEASRVAAEVEAWAEYWQREETERAAREQAERQAAEEAERLAAEQAAREEAERLAAEEAARLAAEEAERQAAEQAAREEAEQAAREEAERVAAEEAARLAAEEAERQAAELAAREEAERLAAEQAAREEAEQRAAEKAERAARRKAEKAEAAEAARREDKAAAAHAMLIELNSSATVDEPAEEPDAPEAEAEVEPAPEPVPVGVGAAAEAMPELADTAALLRELSSLGTEDEEPSGVSASMAAQRAARNPAADEKKPRKKIGLFGL